MKQGRDGGFRRCEAEGNMRPRLLMRWMTATLGSSLVLGCASSKTSQSYSDGPLLQSKAAVEGKAVSSGVPVAKVELEPQSPTPPTNALASLPKPMPRAEGQLAVQPK